ncbi:uncharacterized protein ColSpa_06575 [Colletotrichum spaethianum]|uniref:Cupin type-1 domain-containing protein n=1 Tax=Colletotrichum spaethianum TaxID=700344 RepID=A0AA37LHI0_9PEZI|nr:uncharacterized protein ColSpa_06575 [Colletotrichum spaethianum]GKT46394.1 hypothetical protein ColSpa_06575 [Colletotrichum spaethianum]
MPLRGPVPVKLFKKEDSEKISVGPMTIYIFEDGSNTDNRIGCMTLELPPATSGPPLHWHRFHDECFFITKGGGLDHVARYSVNELGRGHVLLADVDDESGTVRFKTPEGDVDAEEGQVMVVPPRAIHSFANASETEPAEFFMTSTPDFRTIGKTVAEGKKMSPDETQRLMALFGTFPPDVESEP